MSRENLTQTDTELALLGVYSPSIGLPESMRDREEEDAIGFHPAHIRFTTHKGVSDFFPSEGLESPLLPGWLVLAKLARMATESLF